MNLPSKDELSELCNPGTTNPFTSFRFTGSLRPAYPLSPRRRIPDHIPRPDYAEDSTTVLVPFILDDRYLHRAFAAGIPHSELKEGYSGPIKILTQEEQEGMRVVCKVKI